MNGGRKLFGTDGIRGRANEEPMTARTALSVAMAAARQFRRGDHRHRVVIGKDTRLSGYMLEPALTAGFVAEGMDVILLGPLPTPAVAMLTRSLRADLGVMISASHNPYQDNGIKLFGPDGYKLSDAVESSIESMMEDERSAPEAGADGLGRASRLGDAVGRYVEYVKATSPGGLRLDGLRVVLDCAHGAAYKVAPAILWELGAEVITMGVQPNGRNINDGCGATHPEALCEAVTTHGAQAGLALDGDADRLIMVDETGRVVDGDQLIALIAASWHKEGRLAGGRVVTTVMSNLGFERFLTERGIALTRTPVGDRYVVEAMRASGANVGGEQSGHIILGDYSTTGDAMIAALQVLAILKDRAAPASQVCASFQPLPQILKNVRAPGTVLDIPSVRDAIQDAERRLSGRGRVLIRKSGTEPLIRVMAEGDDAVAVSALVDGVADVIRTAAEKI